MMNKDRQTGDGRVCRPPGLEFSLPELPADGLEAAFEVEAFQAGGLLAPPGGVPPELDGPLRGELILRPLRGGWLVKVRMRARVRANCDFCLTGYGEQLEIEFTEPVQVTGVAEAFEREAACGGETWDLSNDDGYFFLIKEKNGRFNLWPLLAEQFWLAWPQCFRCRPGCRGLCPKCGADLNKKDCGCRALNPSEAVPGFGALNKFKITKA